MVFIEPTVTKMVFSNSLLKTKWCVYLFLYLKNIYAYIKLFHLFCLLKPNVYARLHKVNTFSLFHSNTNETTNYFVMNLIRISLYNIADVVNDDECD